MGARRFFLGGLVAGLCLIGAGMGAPAPKEKYPDNTLVFSLPKDAQYEAQLAEGQLILRFSLKDGVEWNSAQSTIPKTYKLVSSRNNKAVYEIIFAVPGAKAFAHGRAADQLHLTLSPKEEKGLVTVTDPAEPLKAALNKPDAPPQTQEKPETASDAPTSDPGLFVTAAEKNGVLTLSFPWTIPVGAAIARRGNILWVVFDASMAPDVGQVLKGSKNYVEGVTPYTSGTYTAFAFKVPFNVNANVQKKEAAWQVTLQRGNVIPPKAVVPMVADRPDHKLKFLYPMTGAKGTLVIKDPDVGDAITFVPTQTLGQGYNLPADTLDFQLLPTIQGAALVPKRQDLIVTVGAQALEIDRKDGLLLSGNGDRARQRRHAVARQLFDFQKWGHFDAPWVDTKQKMQQAIVHAPEKKKNRVRLELVQFYVARGDGVEALAVLEYMANRHGEIEKDPGFIALRGAAHFLAGHYGQSEADFLSPELVDEPEAKIWAGMCAARRRDWETAYAQLRLGRLVVARYPDTLKPQMTYLASETAYQAGALKDAEEFLEALKDAKLSPDNQELYELQKSKVLYKKGKKEKAWDVWESLIQGAHYPRAQVEAAYLKAYTGVSEGRISNQDAIKLLESIRYSWRGDDLEMDVLHLLASLYQKGEKPKEWLGMLNAIVKKFPHHPKTPQIKAELETAIERVFSDQLAKPIAPITMLGLFRDFRDLIPRNERGEAMMADLIDRLVKVDLLTEASKILKRQVMVQQDPIKRAELGTRLALLNVLDRRPQKAMKALDLSATDQTLPLDIATKRKYLQARILAMLQKPDEAQKILMGDESLESHKILSEIYWGQKKWAEAAQSLAAVEAQDPPRDDKVPTEDERKIRAARLADYAIALYLSGQKDVLAQLAQDKAKYVVGTPHEATFMMVTTPQGDAVPLEQEAIKARMAQIGKFEGFVTEYRKKLEAGGASKL